MGCCYCSSITLDDVCVFVLLLLLPWLIFTVFMCVCVNVRFQFDIIFVFGLFFCILYRLHQIVYTIVCAMTFSPIEELHCTRMHRDNFTCSGFRHCSHIYIHVSDTYIQTLISMYFAWFIKIKCVKMILQIQWFCTISIHCSLRHFFSLTILNFPTKLKVIIFFFSHFYSFLSFFLFLLLLCFHLNTFYLNFLI